MKSMERNNTKHETNEEWKKKKEKPKYKGCQNQLNKLKALKRIIRVISFYEHLDDIIQFMIWPLQVEFF